MLLCSVVHYYNVDLVDNKKPKYHTLHNGHYWLVRQDHEWQKECHLNEKAANRAIRYLRKKGYLSVRNYLSNDYRDEDGIPQSATFIRVKIDALEAKIREMIGESDEPQTDNPPPNNSPSS